MIILNILCGLLLLIVGVILGAWLHVIFMMYLHDEKPESFYELMNKYFYKVNISNVVSIIADSYAEEEHDEENAK